MHYEDLYLYRIPPAKDMIQSFLISLIDGTCSMNKEYEQIIEAYTQTFKDNQESFQWEQTLYPLIPFRYASKGNISAIFKSVFQLLLNSKEYPTNITFLFVSDGREDYQFEEIADLICRMKQKGFQMQFISVAIGDAFPNSISNNLRNKIHNQNSDCPPIVLVKRHLFRTKELIVNDFLQAFQQVKQHLLVNKQHSEVTPQVYQTIGDSNRTNKVWPNEIVLAGSKEIVVNNQVVAPSNDIKTLNEMLKKSIQQNILITDSERSEEEVQSICKLIQQRVDKILFKIETQEQSQLIEELQVKLNLIDQIANKNLQPKQLNEEDKTLIQANMAQCDLDEIADKLIKKQNPTLQGQLNVYKTQLAGVKAACFARCKSNKLNVFQNVEKLAAKNLEIIAKIIEEGKQQDESIFILELKMQIENKLLEVFPQQDFQVNDDCYQYLRKLMQIFKLFDSLLNQKNQKKDEIVTQIKTVLQNNQTIGNQDFTAIPLINMITIGFRLINSIQNQFNLYPRKKYSLDEQLEFYERGDTQNEEVIINHFEKLMKECLNQCQASLRKLSESYNEQMYQLVLQCINKIIGLMKEYFIEILEQKKIIYPKRNYESFRKTIAILYHLDTQVNNKVPLNQIIDLLSNCIVCKGSVKQFVEQQDLVNCQAYDYLSMPKLFREYLKAKQIKK